MFSTAKPSSDTILYMFQAYDVLCFDLPIYYDIVWQRHEICQICGC